MSFYRFRRSAFSVTTWHHRTLPKIPIWPKTSIIRRVWIFGGFFFWEKSPSYRRINTVTPFFAKTTFCQCGNICHSAHLLSNSCTSRPIRIPLDLELQAFRQYFCIVCIESLPRYVLMHSKHLNVVRRETNVSKCCNSSDLVKRWYEFSSVRLE